MRKLNFVRIVVVSLFPAVAANSRHLDSRGVRA